MTLAGCRATATAGVVVRMAAMRRYFVLSSGGGVLMTYINEPAAIPR